MTRTFSVCLWLLCASVAGAAPRGHREDPRETLRIQRWLSGVETFLRSRDVSHLTSVQRERRALHLRNLHAYRVAGRFPHNHVTCEPTPVFIDEHGTACAVGHLLLQGGAPELAHQIAREHLLARLPTLDSPALGQWARENGFTLEELALIQPTYRPEPRRICLEEAPMLFSFNRGAWQEMRGPGDSSRWDVDDSVAYPWFVDSEVRSPWLISSHGMTYQWDGRYFQPRPNVTFHEVLGAAALPLSPDEVLLALPADPGTPSPLPQGPRRRTGAEESEGGVQPELYSLWRERGAGTVFGVGRDGRIFQRTPYESWVALTTPSTQAPLLSIDGTGPENIWAVGGGGVALHFDGARWRRVETGTTEGLIAVRAVSPDTAWAVGTRGTALYFDGSAWQSIPTGVTGTLRAVAVRDNEVWLGGDNGLLLHSQGGAWRREDLVTPASITSFGTTSTHLFAATNAQVGCTAHFIVTAVQGSPVIRQTEHVLKSLRVYTAERYWKLLNGGTALLAALPLVLLPLGLLPFGRGRSWRKWLVWGTLALFPVNILAALALHSHVKQLVRFGGGITPDPVEVTRMQDWLLLEHDLSSVAIVHAEGSPPVASRDSVSEFIEAADSLTSPRDLELRERYARLIASGAQSPFVTTEAIHPVSFMR
ncbi:WD40/YVTN/BNR-like repeat-containing protein [Pyxidicoccus xibeiensis]|uniref:WD40/YVTN/BNR-like repeat-containing protein n=1 Tax=Pyxidicoccus xibeiensis TaxID=2906759 RepID=UPI0020A759EE|nr:hypothetical protein [Pyxidicoccus xibeiensis]MCP3138069.1 hypothetical protein [Pyxidicoccus xibeiensis]